MLKMKSSLLAVFFSLFVFTTTQTLAADGDVLVVAIGGYSSCGSSSTMSQESPYGMGMYQNISRMHQKLVAKVGRGKIKTIWACLFTSPPPTGEGSFVTSEAPKKLRYGNGYDLYDEIRAMVEDPATPIFIMGHSYGGWLTMFLAEELGDNYNVQGIFTLDPISPKTCGPLGVVFGASGCHQAPKDLDNRSIASNVKVWQNFYQNQDTWLTSSKIPEAENHHMKYRGAHSKIDQDARVWNHIGASISSRVN